MTPLNHTDENDSDSEGEIHDVLHASNTSNEETRKESGAPGGSITPCSYASSTAALCLCTLTHSYLLISVFPYSGFMAIDLISSANEETAGRYAGFIAASFMVGRAVSSYIWGKIADTYGRRFVLHSSLLLSSIFSVLFGLSPTFAWALVWRCLLGLGNGMIGTAKTAVSELAGDDPALETRGMGIVLGMWGWGFLMSPAISGSLAEPVRQYPYSQWVQRFEPVLSKFPFLLPNLVGALFCITTVITVFLFVPETLPEDKRRSPKHLCDDWRLWYNSFRTCGRSRLEPRVSSIEFTPIAQSEGVASVIDASQSHVHGSIRPKLKSKQSELSLNVPTGATLELSDDTVTMASLWARSNTRRHLLVYWAFSFAVIATDEAFPLFCISKEAGLGLSEASIGKILSGSGLLFAVSQYFVYGCLVEQFGLYGSIRIGGLVSSLLVGLYPFAVLIERASVEDEMSWATYYFLCIVAAGVRVFCLAFFSSITIATNRTVPTAFRGSMNGLSMLGGSIAKAVGPAFAGILVTFSISSDSLSPKIGAFFIFVAIGFISLAASLCSISLGSDDELPMTEIES